MRLILFSVAIVLLQLGPTLCEEKKVDFEKLFDDLDDDDFEIRERAARALTWETPPSRETARKVQMESFNERHGLEARIRLRTVAKDIIMLRVLPLMAEYKRLHGDVGMYYSAQWSQYNEVDASDIYGEDYVMFSPPRLAKRIGVRVDYVFPGGWGNGILEKWDVIIKVDGEPADSLELHDLATWGIVEAGREYEITFRRYENVKEINERGCILPDQDKDYRVLRRKVKIGWKKGSRINKYKMTSLEKTVWKDFMEECRRLQLGQGTEEEK